MCGECVRVSGTVRDNDKRRNKFMLHTHDIIIVIHHVITNDNSQQ